MSATTTPTAPPHAEAKASPPALCHSLDIHGRPLCGADLAGRRMPHPIGTCVVDGHRRCATCDSLMMLPSEGLGGELEAA